MSRFNDSISQGLTRLMVIMTVCFACFNPANAEAKRTLDFTYITDVHAMGASSDRRIADPNISEFVRYSNSHPEVQFAVFGGDFYNSYETNHRQALWCIEHIRAKFQDLKVPFYTTKGNHDCNPKCLRPDGTPDNSQIITDREYYNLFSPVSRKNPLYHPEGIVIDPNNPEKNYYYRDFEDQEFRLIILNNYDLDSLEEYGYHGEQMKWLTEKALDFEDKQNPENWTFLIVGHAFSINFQLNPITRLLHAYVRGIDFFDTDNGVSYGAYFSQMKRGKLIAMIFGHFHDDIYWNWDGYNMIASSRGYASQSESRSVNESLCFEHFSIDFDQQTISAKRIGRGEDRVFSYATVEQVSPRISFPEADGMGQYTQGGTGGRVLHVTNLNDSGEGSLRWAIEQQGSRVVVFDVGGTIWLKSPLEINNDSISILGQSNNIVLRGAPLQINANEVTVRFITTRDGLRDGRFGQHHLMLDHITASADTCPGIEIRYVEQATIQMCNIAIEDQNRPALVAGGFKTTYYNNLIKDCNRAIFIPSREGQNRWIQLSRNVVENWGEKAIYGGGMQGEISIHDNYFIPGPQTKEKKFLTVAEDGTARYYLTQNEIKGIATHDQSLLINDDHGVPYYPESEADTIDRPKMNPVARPHTPDRSEFANTCLVKAAFTNKPIFKRPTHEGIYKLLSHQAGSQFRAEQAQLDSLYQDNAEAYLTRIAKQEKHIVILFENDVHCELDGYPYLAGFREMTEADTAHVALVSCGDFLQGGLAGAISRGKAIVDIMGAMHYDAVTLGNHEFDYAVAEVKKLLEKNLNTDIVCANLRNIEKDTLVFAPYVIKQYGRRKVAFVGVTTPTIEKNNAISLHDNRGRLAYDCNSSLSYKHVQRSVNEARAKGADFVIVLSHLGEATDEMGFSSINMIASTTGIDAVLDGHTHTVLPATYHNDREGNPVLLCQTGCKFQNIGRLSIDPAGNIYAELIPTKTLMYEDPKIAILTDSIKQIYTDITEMPIGRTMKAFEPYITRHSNGSRQHTQAFAADLVCDAMVWAGKADIACFNARSIREGLPLGEITRGNIYAMAPYENYVVVRELTGKQIRRIIEMLMANLKDKERINPTAGLSVKVEQNGKNTVIKEILIRDKKGWLVPLNDDMTYRVATTDYFIKANRRLPGFGSSVPTEHTGLTYGEATIRYIQEELKGIVNDPMEGFPVERIDIIQK